MKLRKHIIISVTLFICLCLITQGCGKGNSSYHNNQGLDYYSKGMYDQAIEEFNTLLKANPSDAEAHYNLGLAYYAKGVHKKAAIELKKAVEINPKFLEKLDAEHKSVLIPTPTNAKAFNALGLAYVDKGMYDQAIATYENALRIHPNDAELHYNLALAYRGKGLTDKAAYEYREVIAINPNLVEARYNLAVAYLNKGMNEPAISEFNEVLSLLSPNQKKRLAATHLKLGMAYSAEGMLDMAIPFYQRALELNPNYPRAKAVLQNAYKKNKGR
ncbi:MAG: tetratricopeptide repeat protein [Candidatus Brocadiales bacterium]